MQPESKFKALLCLRRIRHNCYWKNKFLKRATYSRYVTTKLSKIIQIACWPPQNRFYRRFIENWKWRGTSFQATLFIELFDKNFFYNISWTSQISLPECFYFPCYSICVSCFMFRHLMMSWHLNIWKC